MRGNNVLGILFSNMKDQTIRELTEMRTMGSVPVGGRYRLIDFPLSNMANSGITRVGVVTKSNYRSLMDHVGSGKAWNMSRKHSGLVFLPPYGSGNVLYQNRIGALSGIREFLESSKEEFVFMADCDVVANMDIQEVVRAHVAKGADITVVYKRGELPDNMDGTTTLSVDMDGRVREVLLHSRDTGVHTFDTSMYVVRREFLIQLINDAVSHNLKDFEADILQAGVTRYRIFGFEHKGYAGIVTSMNSYYQLNKSLLDADVRAQLFPMDRPIYTKVRDDMPARYGMGASVKNSLVADGCVIEGEVENCVLFRGVTIKKGARVRNSIIMQSSIIGENCDIDYLILDKDVEIHSDRRLMGFESYPVYISKGSRV
ncbi:MAG: glucose-1-phosphate adenylyltransferase subunit GlgD [Clostridia bacterium]|nr:glucose-1-phosphate adenylyltransferase subunit GlgD [Clostridia bacterium]